MKYVTEGARKLTNCPCDECDSYCLPKAQSRTEAETKASSDGSVQ